MTSYKYMSDGLGGHVGLSCSPGLGSAKRVTKNKTHILLFNILLVFLCEFESAAHFLFNCPIYTNERQTCLPNNLRTFTTKDLLFGCENASEQDNQSLFLQVQDFIVNSGRFP